MRHIQITRYSVLSFAMVLTVMVARASGQYLQETGSPTFATADTVEMGFINISNGNLHIEIPIASYSQRGGMKFTAKMVYDSRIWKIVDNGASLSWQPTNVPGTQLGIPEAQMGWRFQTTGSGSISYDQIANTCYSNGTPYTWYQWQNYRFNDVDGTIRRFPLYYESGAVCHTAGTATASGPSLEGTGQLASWTTYASNVEDVLSASGNTLYKWGPSVFTIAKDTNGNYLDKDSSGTITDTLGRTVWQKTLEQGTSTKEIDYAVPTSQGTSTYKFFFSCCVAIQTTFGASGVAEYSSSGLQALTRIDLPDGTSYGFGYENYLDNGQYGMLKSITLLTEPGILVPAEVRENLMEEGISRCRCRGTSRSRL